MIQFGRCVTFGFSYPGLATVQNVFEVFHIIPRTLPFYRVLNLRARAADHSPGMRSPQWIILRFRGCGYVYPNVA